MNESNKIVLRKLDYQRVEDFYDILFKQLRLLMETNNTYSVHENPQIKGTYVIQFGPSKVDEMSSYPVWLSGDEILYVSEYAKRKAYEQAKELVNDSEEDDDNFWKQDDNDNGGLKS